MQPSVSPTRQLERQVAAEDARRLSRLFDSPSEPSLSPPKPVPARDRQSIDELVNVRFSVFADSSGRLSTPGSVGAADNSTAPKQPSDMSGSHRRGARSKQRLKLYEHANSDPRSILHSSSLGEMGTLRTRLRRPKRLDPYHDPIPRTAPSVDARALSPSRNLGLRGKSRSEPRLATLSPKRYGSKYSTICAAGSTRMHGLGVAAHSSSMASDRPRVVARGNLTVCLTQPTAHSMLRRSASSPLFPMSVDRASTPSTAYLTEYKQKMKGAPWADERPSALEWTAEPELGDMGLPHLRRALKTADGFESKRYVLARASIA